MKNYAYLTLIFKVNGLYSTYLTRILKALYVTICALIYSNTHSQSTLLCLPKKLSIKIILWILIHWRDTSEAVEVQCPVQWHFVKWLNSRGFEPPTLSLEDDSPNHSTTAAPWLGQWSNQPRRETHTSLSLAILYSSYWGVLRWNHTRRDI